MTASKLLYYWVLMLISGGMLHASVMMLWTGTAWPIKSVKLHPILGTALFVIGMTGLLVFGTQDLLQQTLALASQ